MSRSVRSIVSSGFMLIEVLVASLLLCVTAASIAYLINTGIRSISASKHSTKDAMLAASVMEELRGKEFGDIISYNGTSFDGGRGNIKVTSAGADLLDITVTHNIELNTLRSRYK